MKKRGVSREDVARAAGVSGATVSYVLNARRDVTLPESTRARVLTVAQRLGYTINRNARSLVSGTTRTLGVIVGNRQMSSFSAGLLTGIEKECARRDYRLLLSLGGAGIPALREQARLYVEHRVDGILMFSDCHSPENEGWYEGAIREGLPMALLDQRLGTRVRGIDCVVSDDVAGAAAITRHLIALGHRRIAHLAGTPDRTTARDRRRGWAQALRAAGLPVEEKWVLGRRWEPDWGYAALAKSFARPRREWPTAIFAANDLLAVVVFRFAAQRGLRIPDELSVAGYGDEDSALGLDLTTVNQQTDRMGAAAVDCVLSRATAPAGVARRVLIPVQLVTRGSTAACHSG